MAKTKGAPTISAPTIRAAKFGEVLTLSRISNLNDILLGRKMARSKKGKPGSPRVGLQKLQT
jgi:hypothetical protein